LLSIVRDNQPDHKAWEKVKFMVFDLPDAKQPFSQRIRLIDQIVSALNIPWLKAVKQWKEPSHGSLMRQLKVVTQAGAEGLMLHRGSSFYKWKRSGDLLKVKSYEDAEAVVIKHIDGKGKYTGLMGALLVRSQSGLSFKIGTGFSDAERRNPPKIGDTVTYQYHGKTRNGIPRFASFLRRRTLEH